VLGAEEDDGAPLVEGISLSLAVGGDDKDGALDIEGKVLGAKEDDGAPLIDGISLSLPVGDADDEGALELEGRVLGTEEDDGAPLIDGISLSLPVGDADDEGALDIEGIVLGAEEDDGAPLIDGISLSLAVGDADKDGALDIEGIVLGAEEDDGNCLVKFYHATHDNLASPVNWKPLGKFMCIKGVVFFTWWQGVAIAVLKSYDLIGDIGAWDVNDVANGLQDYLICVEMFCFAIAHSFTFTHLEYLPRTGRALPIFGCY